MQVSPTAKHEFTRRSLITDDHLEVFGHTLVRACMHSRDFFDLALMTVNYDANTTQYSKNDFLSGAFGNSDGLLFAGMIDFKGHYYAGNPWPSSPMEWMLAIAPHLRRKFANNPSWPKDYLESALIDVITKYQAPAVGEYDLVCDGMVDYVRGIRLRHATMSLKNLDPTAKQKLIDDVKTTIRVPGQEAVLCTIEDHITSLLNFKTQTHTFRTGVTSFDTQYGDYAAPGDAWLAAGLPGAGKTVVACQVAGATAAIGRKVLLVTTEVAAQTCILRACAANQGISFSALKAVRGSGSLEATDHGLQLRQWVSTVGRNIFAVDYASMPGDTFEDRMAAILLKFEKIHGQMPELVLFDWIGKAANVAFADSWQKREHYSRIGMYMSDLADQLNIVTWTFAQADPAIRNKVDIAETAHADCKALSQTFESAMFMTSLMELNQGGNDIEDAYQQRQWWVIPKCRDRETKKLPVIRRFEMQRFDAMR